MQRGFVVANAVVGCSAGIVLLVIPELFLSLLGLRTDATGVALGRLYGAELAGFSVATWLLRTAVPLPTPLVAGHIVNETLTAIVLASIGLGGGADVLIWPLAAVAAVFAVGYAAIAIQGRAQRPPTQ